MMVWVHEKEFREDERSQKIVWGLFRKGVCAVGNEKRGIARGKID